MGIGVDFSYACSPLKVLILKISKHKLTTTILSYIESCGSCLIGEKSA